MVGAERVRTDAILDATIDLVGEVGYDRLTMDAVAARSRSSKATIYRHWPGKAELVADALRACSVAPADIPDTGCLRTDLLAVVARMAEAMGGSDGALIFGICNAAGRDPALRTLLGDTMHESKRPLWQLVVDRAVARGELADSEPAVTRLHDVAPAVGFFTSMMTSRPLDEIWQHHLVDDVLLPLLRA
jgi:AcrR family transcriptional regulator